MPESEKQLLRHSPKVDERSLLFVFSALMFQMGLAFATFEQVRPFGIQVSDYCFCLSLLLFVFCPNSRLFKSMGSGVLLAASLILCGSLLSLVNVFNADDALHPLARPFLLFGLFAPLALNHSRSFRKNMLFVMGGISVNCAITLLQAWVFPGIVDTLSINPLMPEYISDLGRFQGLTGHPNTLGLSAALAIVIGIAFLSFETRKYVRLALIPPILISFLAALLSGSRTFLASLVPGLITFALLSKIRLRTVVAGLAAVVVLWGTLTYLAPSVLSKYTERIGLSGLDYSSDYGRILAAGLAVDQILEKPILGWGVDQLGKEKAGEMLIPLTGELTITHITFLQYWYGAGLLGAIGYLALFALPARQMLRALKKNPSNNLTGPLRLALACYVMLFIVSNLHPIIYNRFLYLPVFICAGFAAHCLGPVETRSVARSRAATRLAPNAQAST